MTTTSNDPRPGAHPEAGGPGSQRNTPGPAAYRVESLAVGALFVAACAFLAAIVAVGLAARSIDEHRAVANAVTSPGAGAGGAAVAVSLTEFAIAPEPVTIPAGAGALTVTNEGSLVHNLSVDGLATPMLNGGEAADLDISGLQAGTYTVRCDVPGHEAAGMVGTLSIG